MQFLGRYLHHALSVRHGLFRGVPACSMDLSTATIPWRCLILQGILQGPVHSEIDLLQHGPTHSHSPFRNRPEIVPTWPHPWLQALQGCSCSVMGLSMATFFEVLQHNLMHSHWCCRVHRCSRDHPQPRMLPSVPSPAWTYPWTRTPSDMHLL